MRLLRFIVLPMLLTACVNQSPQKLVATSATKPRQLPTEMYGGNRRQITLLCDQQNVLMIFNLKTPKWPTSASEEMDRALVQINFVVNQDGSLSSLRVVHSTDIAFDKSALDAMSQSSIEVTEENGQCVVGKSFTLPIQFQLN